MLHNKVILAFHEINISKSLLHIAHIAVCFKKFAMKTSSPEPASGEK